MKQHNPLNFVVYHGKKCGFKSFFPHKKWSGLYMDFEKTILSHSRSCNEIYRDKQRNLKGYVASLLLFFLNQRGFRKPDFKLNF